MFAKLKAALGGLVGPAEDPAVPPVDYKGYRIRPTPYLNGSAYQVAGTIEKDTADGVKAHPFVRADTCQSRDDAVAFTITKAQQIIDQQGERIFG